MIVRKELNSYWLIGTREKGLSKSEIMKLDLASAMEKYETNLSTIPFKDASIVLTGFVKVVNKKLDYCLSEVLELLDACNNPTSKKVAQLNSSFITKKTKKAVPQRNIEEAALEIKEDSVIPQFNNMDDNVIPEDFNENVTVEIPSKNPQPGIEGSLQELGNSLNATPIQDSDSMKKILERGSSDKKSLFTPKEQIRNAMNASALPDMEIPPSDVKTDEQVSMMAKELFAQLDKESEKDDELEASKQNKIAILKKDHHITNTTKVTLASIKSIKERYETASSINNIIKTIENLSLGADDTYMKEVYSKTITLKYEVQQAQPMVNTENNEIPSIDYNPPMDDLPMLQ